MLASEICLRLFEQVMRAAASRTFCTAGRSRPMRVAMMAITNSSSINVKPGRHREGEWRRALRPPPSGQGGDDDDVGLGDGVIVRRGVTRCQVRFSFFTHPVSCRDGRQAKSAVAVYGKMGRLPDEEVAVKIDRSVEVW